MGLHQVSAAMPSQQGTIETRRLLISYVTNILKEGFRGDDYLVKDQKCGDRP